MTARALMGKLENLFRSAPAVMPDEQFAAVVPGDIREKCAAVSAAATVIAREGIDRETAEIFAALVIFSDEKFSLKTVLGALSRGRLSHGDNIVTSGMANLGFYVVKSVASPDLLSTQGPACLVREGLNGRKYVVVTDSVSGRSFRLSEGATPEPYDARNLSPQWQIVTFAFRSASDPLSAARRGHTGLSWIAALASRFQNIWITLAAISLALAVLGVLSVAAISTIFSEVIGRSALDTLPILAIGLILILLVDTRLCELRSNMLAWVANRLEFLVNASSFDQILRLPPFISERAPPAAQAARMRSFEGIRDFLVSPACPAAMDIVLAPFFVAIVAVIDWRSALVVAAAMASFFVLFFVGLRFARVSVSIVADEATEAQRIAIETFDRMQMIRDIGLQHVWSARVSERLVRDQAAQAQLQKLGAAIEAASSAVFSGFIIVLMVMRGLAVKSSIAGGVEVLAMTILGLRCLLPFHSLCLSVLRVEQIRKSLNQVNQFSEVPNEFDRSKGRDRMEGLSGAVSLVHLGFRAADTRPLFVGLDLEIQPGEVIGLYGPAGTGKSIILKMMLGMMEIGLGVIRIDGVDIRQFSVEELRRRVSYIPQQPSLLPGTLRDNLLFADPLASDQSLNEILRLVGLEDDISRLPNGLDHLITADESRSFSDEFRLSIGFARALLTNSKLFLIDEFPNSVMEKKLGALLRRLVADFRGHRTIIFVSHRADFLGEADRIVELTYGGVPRILAGRHVRNARRA